MTGFSSRASAEKPNVRATSVAKAPVMHRIAASKPFHIL